MVMDKFRFASKIVLALQHAAAMAPAVSSSYQN